MVRRFENGRSFLGASGVHGIVRENKHALSSLDRSVTLIRENVKPENNHLPILVHVIIV
jgi:hypothetical protein